MQKRYIDAGEAESRIQDLFPDMPRVDLMDNRRNWREKNKQYLECLDVIRSLPPADVVEKERYDRLLENSIIIADALSKYQSADMAERKHGKWVDDCSCSICHWIHEDDKGFALLTNYNFCPNCGAEMEGSEDNEQIRTGRL